MKNMEKKLIFLFEKYVLLLLIIIIKRWGETTHGTGEWPYHGMHVEVIQTFCGVGYLLLLLRGF